MRFVQRPNNFSDWDGLRELLVECFAYMDDVIDPPSSLRQTTADDLRKKAIDQTLILVWDDKKLVACAYFDIRHDAVYIGKIAVTSSHRGQNIARQIFDMAENLANENAKAWLELETRIELTDNHLAFGKMGFVISAHNSHAGYSRPTSITMRKPVKITV